MAMENFCLKWNDHQNVLLNNVDRLLQHDFFVDCTLAAEGQFIGAHKLVLSACSPYFEALLRHHREKHPIFILKDIKFEEVKAIMAYMYRGEVIIPYDKLAELLRAAESLQVKGLGDKNAGKSSEVNGLPQLQQKTPNRPIQTSVTQARSGGSGEPRRNVTTSAEVVDLTDEPQRPRVQKQIGQQRVSPYVPRKYNRKLDYPAPRVVQRNAPAQHPNSPGSTVVRSIAPPVASKNISIAAAHVQQVPTYASVQYASQPTPSQPTNKQPIVQHVTSLAPGYQREASPLRNVLHFTSPPAASTLAQKSQNVQGLRRTPPAGAVQMQPRSSPVQQTFGGVDSPQAQQIQVHPSQIQNIQLQQVQIQPSQTQPSQTKPPQTQPSQTQPSQTQPSQAQSSQIQSSQIKNVLPQQSQVQSSQIQNIQVQQSLVQQPQIHNTQMQSPREHSPLLTESPQVHSPQEGTLAQGSVQQDEAMETPEFSAESQNDGLSSIENSMNVSTDDLSMELESSNISLQAPDENSNDTSNISEDKLGDEEMNSNEGTSSELKAMKGKRGRPASRPGVDRPFKCPDCGRMFSQKCNMEKHRKIHTEECLNCDICDKSFVGRSALIRHLRQHKNKSGHKCQLCGLMFPSPKALEEHLTLHAGTSAATDQ